MALVDHMNSVTPGFEYVCAAGHNLGHGRRGIVVGSDRKGFLEILCIYLSMKKYIQDREIMVPVQAFWFSLAGLPVALGHWQSQQSPSKSLHRKSLFWVGRL
jgi:hypothetical protein